jgi:hypothetical protein
MTPFGSARVHPLMELSNEIRGGNRCWGTNNDAVLVRNKQIIAQAKVPTTHAYTGIAAARARIAEASTAAAPRI